MSDQDQHETPVDQPEVDVFEGRDQKPTDQRVESGAKDSYQELLAAIQNEEGNQKYKSVSEALVGASHAQAHIKRLEQEMADLRARVTEADTRASLVDSVRDQGKDTSKPQLSRDELFDAFNQFDQAKRQQEMRQQNRTKVNTGLRERFGEAAANAVNRRAQEMGVTPEFLLDIGEKSPSAFFEYFKTETKGSPSTTTSTDVNLSGKGKTEEPSANIMYGASTQDVLNVWRAAGEKVKG